MDGKSTSIVLEQDKEKQKASLVAHYASLLPQGAAVVYQVSTAYEQAAQELKQLENLSEDWDGYGALRVSRDALANAFSLVHTACVYNVSSPPPLVAPNPNGTVGLEWQKEGREAYFEVGNTRASGYCLFANQRRLYLQGSTAEVSAILPGLVSLLSEPARPIVRSQGHSSAWIDDAGTD